MYKTLKHSFELVLLFPRVLIYMYSQLESDKTWFSDTSHNAWLEFIIAVCQVWPQIWQWEIKVKLYTYSVCILVVGSREDISRTSHNKNKYVWYSSYALTTWDGVALRTHGMAWYCTCTCMVCMVLCVHGMVNKIKHSYSTVITLSAIDHTP